MDAFWDRSYFFDQGIFFECRGCGRCCGGAPGVIRVTEEDICRIADFLHMPYENAYKNCVYPYQEHYSIRERSDGYCLFYEAGCRIYPVRPIQCRTYPFWINNLRSEKNWQRTVKSCPGIGRGTLYTKDQILTLLNHH